MTTYIVFSEKNKKFELFKVCKKVYEAENAFISKVSESCSNFEDYTSEDIDAIKSQGYENINSKTIQFDSISAELSTIIIDSNSDYFINEKMYPKFRDLLSNLVTEHYLENYISWFCEDNSGPIQIQIFDSLKDDIEYIINDYYYEEFNEEKFVEMKTLLQLLLIIEECLDKKISLIEYREI